MCTTASIRAQKAYRQRKKLEKSQSKATSVNDVKNFDELESYMNSKYSITIDSDVKRLNFNAVQQSLQGVEEMMNDYPELRSSITEIKTRNSGIMSCSGDAINFNPEYYKGDVADITLNGMAKSAANSGWWAGNTVSSALGVHETAHALVWHITQQAVEQNHPELSSELKIRAATKLWNEGSIAKVIVDAATQRAKNSQYGKKKSVKALTESISQYANKFKEKGKKAHEVIAEAFADVKGNGDKASHYSKEVYSVTNEVYSRFKK